MIDVPREDIIVMLEAGYIYLAMRRFKESKTIFEGVLELAPKHDVPSVAIANVFFTQGKFLEAIRILKKTIKDNPNSAYAYAHLGESQLFYGKKDEALKNLNVASEMEPTGKNNPGEFARALIELINQGYDPVEYRKAFKKMMDEQKAKQQQEAMQKEQDGQKQVIQKKI